MCSWCWGFRPVWELIRQNLPDNLQVKNILGGLAPDSDVPMPIAMQRDIESYWRKIQKHIPGTEFNFDFWKKCEPRRSTYPACRAVIAARKQSLNAELAMIKAIQNAYYLQAKNPSIEAVLVDLAVSLRLDKEQFIADINSQEIQKELDQEISFSRQIGSQGFPSLIVKRDQEYRIVPLDYNNPDTALMFINKNM